MSRGPVQRRPRHFVGARVEDLAELHRQLSVHLAERMRAGKVSASHLMVIRAFLKDNGIRAKTRADQLAGLDALAALKPPDFAS